MADPQISLPDGPRYGRSNRYTSMRTGGGITRQEQVARRRTAEQWWSDRRTISRYLMAKQDDALRVQKRSQPVELSVRRQITLYRNMRVLLLGLAEPRAQPNNRMANTLVELRKDHSLLAQKIGPFADFDVPGLGRMLHRLIATAEDHTEILPRPRPSRAQRMQLAEEAFSVAQEACLDSDDRTYLMTLLLMFSRAHPIWETEDEDGNIALLPRAAKFLKLIRSTADTVDLASLPVEMNDSSSVQMYRLRLRHLYTEQETGSLLAEVPTLRRFRDIIRNTIQDDMRLRGFDLEPPDYDSWRQRLDEEIANHGDDSL